MANLRDQATFTLGGAAAGMAGLAVSTGGCNGSGCTACFGCACLGLLLAGAAIVKRIKGARYGRDATSDGIMPD